MADVLKVLEPNALVFYQGRFCRLSVDRLSSRALDAGRETEERARRISPEGRNCAKDQPPASGALSAGGGGWGRGCVCVNALCVRAYKGLMGRPDREMRSSGY